MPKPHKEAQARKFLNLIKATLGKTNDAGTDLRCCFAAGAFKLGKPDETSVIIVRPVGLESLESTLKKMAYDNKKNGKKFKSSDPVKGEVVGWVRYDGTNIRVDLKEGNDSKAKKRIQGYFDDFGIGYPKVRIDDPLSEEQKNGLAAIQEDNRNYFNMADDDVEGEEGGADPQTAAAEPLIADPPVDEDSDTEASPIPEPEASAAGDGDVPEENPTEGVEDPAREDVKHGNALSDELMSGIAAESAKIAAHALSLSRQIGAEQKTEQDPLMGKIADWLADMLAATPESERETALHNFTSRLLLMLAYPENLRNLQYVDESQTADRWKKYGADAKTDAGREKVLVNGIDLDSVPTDDLDQTEVTEVLVNLAKAQAKERLLPYPVSQVRPEATPIATIVASGWPTQEGQAAARRQIIERLIAAMKQKFANDDQLIGLLGFKKANAAQGDELVASLVDSIKDVWEARRDTAIKQTDELKRKVNEIVKVEALGGTWRHVDELFLRIDGEISAQLGAISAQDGEARTKAIELVAGTVQSTLGYLDSNPIVGLLDNPPFDAGQGAVGETLRAGLDGVSKGLKRIGSSGTAAGA